MQPVERFDQWRAQNQKLLWSLCEMEGEQFIRAEIKAARLWLMGKGVKTAKNYKDWNRFFVSSWLKKAIKQRDYIQGCMTAKQEDAYYANKQRTRRKSGDFKKIDSSIMPPVSGETHTEND
jgi:hypothetical protein